MYRIEVHTKKQSLELYKGDDLAKSYKVSTGRKGVGQKKDSNQTPLGKHYIRAKIGDGQPFNTAFSSRRPTGEIYTKELGEQRPGADWILTRIMWLSGLEVGHNRLGDVDTMQRYIYIHGTPDDRKVGIPRSQGCICMRNAEVVELFNLVSVGTPIEIF